jgi:hypothetical protein
MAANFICQAERVAIVQNKEKQQKEGAERDKMREEARKAKKREMKELKESKSSSSSAARLAQESLSCRMRENSTSPSLSPSRNAKPPVIRGPKPPWRKIRAPAEERSSSSSLSGGGAAIYD